MVVEQQVGQKGAAHRVRQCNAEGAPHLPGGLQGRFGLLGRRQQGAGVVLKREPRVGQADGLAHPVKQRGAQLGLQLGDLRGDSRLGVAQLPRGAGKAV